MVLAKLGQLLLCQTPHKRAQFTTYQYIPPTEWKFIISKSYLESKQPYVHRCLKWYKIVKR